MTADPLAYLHAAHAQAQAEAEAATSGPWWYNPGKQWLDPEAFERYDLTKGEEFVGYGAPHPFTGAVAATGPANNPQSMADAAFIARHDPAAVLRRITAERKLVASHQPVHDRTGWNNGTYDDIDPACSTCGSDDNATPFPCQTIRALAEAWGWTPTP